MYAQRIGSLSNVSNIVISPLGYSSVTVLALGLPHTGKSFVLLSALLPFATLDIKYGNKSIKAVVIGTVLVPKLQVLEPVGC